MRSRSVAATLCLVALMCAVPAEAQPSPIDPPPPALTRPPERPLGVGETHFVDNPQIVDSHPLPVDGFSRLGAGEGVRVYFTTGTPACFGVHAEVRETPAAVEVALRGGTLPGALGRACIMIAVFGALDIPLSRPLGERELLSVVPPRA